MAELTGPSGIFSGWRSLITPVNPREGAPSGAFSTWTAPASTNPNERAPGNPWAPNLGSGSYDNNLKIIQGGPVVYTPQPFPGDNLTAYQKDVSGLLPPILPRYRSAFDVINNYGFWSGFNVLQGLRYTTGRFSKQ